MREPSLSRVLLIAIVVTTAACDPGYRLKPIGWLEQNGSRYEDNFGEFGLRMVSAGLIGETWLWPTIEVFGNAESVTLNSASLQTAKGSYLGTIDPSIATAPPGGGRLSVRWNFGAGHPAVDVIGSRAEIALGVSVGSRPKIVRIVLERLPCC